jgi:N6-adenosine-specific RNA methylase IME4
VKAAVAKKKYQLFTDLNLEEFAALEQDCVARGIQVPIELDEDGNILDGHNRLEIAQRHSLKYKTVTRRFKTEEEKKIHVLMLNLARRHMKSHQWGGAFKEILKLKEVKTSRGPKGKVDNSASVAEIAQGLGVPERTARQRVEQHDVYEELPKEEREAIDSGEKSISSAVRKEKQERKREEAAETAKMSGKVSVMLADPPWQYGATSVTGSSGQHYATMKTAEICKEPIKKSTTKDSVLFLWVTNPMLPDGLEVIQAWGFKYKTCMVWVKDEATKGLGEYIRGQHELLMIATRGTMIPKKTNRPRSVIEAAVGRHSAKPKGVYRMIEKMYPDQQYGEWFLRGKPAPGWKGYGAEAE